MFEEETLSRLLRYAQWFDWLACDIAGDLSYGHSFDNVKDGKCLIPLVRVLKSY